MKATLQNLEIVYKQVKQHLENPNGEFDGATDLLHAFNAVILWEEEKRREARRAIVKKRRLANLEKKEQAE